jgi:hypothetical protein
MLNVIQTAISKKKSFFLGTSEPGSVRGKTDSKKKEKPDVGRRECY